MDSSIDETKINVELTPPPNTNNKDYTDGTNDKTRESDDYPSDTDGCEINIDDDHKNEEYDDYIDPPSKKNDITRSKLEEDVINRLLSPKK